MKDPFVEACRDYYLKKSETLILVHADKAETEEINIEYFFRNEFPLLERKALELCSGDVLDIGAGTGIHSLELQKKGFSVNALEIKSGLCEIMNKRGLKNVINADIFAFNAKKYDSLLMLMNGIGLCADFNGLEKFLGHARNLLKPGGKIILDSSDLLYLYTEEDGSVSIDLSDDYYGILEYFYEYKGVIGEKFKWLFVDYSNLEFYAEKYGFDCRMVFEDEHYNYLAELQLRL